MHLPIRLEKIYTIKRKINSNQTAMIVMDPWIDYATKHLNDYSSTITEEYITPLIKEGFAQGNPIIILTNNPNAVTYNTKIHPTLEKLVTDNQAALLYHQDYDDKQFADYLRQNNINSLIYTGFASNMCVIGRKMGMIPMRLQNFQTY